MKTRRLNEVIKKLAEMEAKGTEVKFWSTRVDGEYLWAAGTKDEFYGPLTKDQAIQTFDAIGPR